MFVDQNQASDLAQTQIRCKQFARARSLKSALPLMYAPINLDYYMVPIHESSSAVQSFPEKWLLVITVRLGLPWQSAEPQL